MKRATIARGATSLHVIFRFVAPLSAILFLSDCFDEPKFKADSQANDIDCPFGGLSYERDRGRCYSNQPSM
jgi:hypothetical protein